MPRTNLERRLSQRQQDGLIVPLVNELLKDSVGLDTTADIEFLYYLARKQVEREKIRKQSYDGGETVFSPSGLGSCLRRVYLSKNHREHGLVSVPVEAIEPHYYFITGDFIHLKLQFLLYRVSVKWPDRFLLLDTEMPVMSKRKDHGGTIDALVLLDGEPLIVDIKGLNIRTWGKIDKGDVPGEYRIQLTDYMMLFNTMLESGRWKPSDSLLSYMKRVGMKEFPKVKRGILLAENKGGPDVNHPAALTESIINLKSNLPEVRLRLEVLRDHQEKGEIPDAECESTRLIEFTGCPFSEYCKPEVRQREAARIAVSDAKEFRLAKPVRRNRSR